MEQKIYPALIDEATSLLPRLRASLILLAQNEETAIDLSVFIREADSLADSAAMLGHGEMSQRCFDVATELRDLNRPASTTQRSTVRALDLVAKLEASILETSLEDDELSLDIDGFINESFGMFEKPHSPGAPQEFAMPFELDLLGSTQETGLAAPPAFAPADPGSGESSYDGSEFEIDQELLDIFAEEADSLIKSMESNLEILAKEPNNGDALWEVRRNAHTFKGSAGIVGLDQLSKLAHRMEDLLDKLVELKNGSNAAVLHLLNESTAVLKTLTGGDAPEAVRTRIGELYSEFDRLVDLLDQPAPVEETLAPEPVEPEAETLPAPPLEAAEPAEPASEAAEEKVFAVVSPPKPPPARSVVRVSLGKLDELVSLVRDMIVSRSAFEQRLREFDRQIDDLQNTTRRLHTASSKLEIDFEASMLASPAPSFLAARANEFAGENEGEFGDLELDRYTEFHQTTRALAETTSDTFSINTALDSLRRSFELLYDEQRRIVDGLQEKLMRIRMVEFGSLANRLQRAVRVTCDEENKKAQIAIQNEKLEVDTQILDNLIEPLMHLLKNAVVHGIETPEIRRMLGKPEIGLIDIAVANEDTHIAVTISDDGRGINAQALKEKAVSLKQLSADEAEDLSEEELFELVFMPGLTTAKKLNLSAGRGVGMAIVRESIEAQRGTISIESTQQKGTAFKIRIPQKLAVTKVLLVGSGRQAYAIPHSLVWHVDDLPASDGADPTEFIFEEKPIGLTSLETLVNEKKAPLPSDGPRSVLVINSPRRKTAISVASIVRTEEVVIKPLLHPLDKIEGVLGAAVLGNGELVPILDIPSLLKKRPKPVRKVEETPAPAIVSILVVDDSPSVRHLTSKVIERAGWAVKTAKDGIDALETLRTMTGSPSLILTDIEMPRMDGYEFTSCLRRSEEFQNIPVVMITSRTADKHRDKAEETGVTKYLTKPYDEAELIQTVRDLIA